MYEADEMHTDPHWMDSQRVSHSRACPGSDQVIMWPSAPAWLFRVGQAISTRPQYRPVTVRMMISGWTDLILDITYGKGLASDHEEGHRWQQPFVDTKTVVRVRGRSRRVRTDRHQLYQRWKCFTALAKVTLDIHLTNTNSPEIY